MKKKINAVFVGLYIKIFYALNSACKVPHSELMRNIIKHLLGKGKSYLPNEIESI